MAGSAGASSNSIGGSGQPSVAQLARINSLSATDSWPSWPATVLIAMTSLRLLLPFKASNVSRLRSRSSAYRAGAKMLGDWAQQDGIRPAGEVSVDDLDLLLSGVHLDLAPVVLQAGAQFLPAAGLLMALWARRGVAAERAVGGFGADPIGALAADGTLRVISRVSATQ